MNKIFFSLISLLFVLIVSAQDFPDAQPNNDYAVLDGVGITIQKIKLANGLTVYLNQDPNMTDVLGTIVVKGGSKYDPKDATGIAHYFEHIMFKGSQNLGTVDYRAEKIYLDSIRAAYDLLALSKGDPTFHDGIMKNINRLSQKAAEYAIPNEFNKVLSSIGGSQINAYTTYENIVYHNHFPAESMQKWIRLQVDRFADPVFRLFQTELETVYEEKNMSMDNVARRMFREVYKNFYPNSVYGKQSVLGSIEDLKYPSISKMETYFKEYYVANNMALILVGNFDAEMTIQLLEESFGRWREGQFMPIADSEEKAFNGRVEVKTKLTPIAVGILGFRTVPKGHPDELGLEVINSLLSNNQSTGLLDDLVTDQKLMEAGLFADMHYDIGGNFIYYVPKLLTQSLKSGEKLILAQLDSLKTGNFDNSLLQAVLVNKRKDMLMRLENSDYRSRLIIDAFMTNQSVNDILSKVEKMNQLDKQKIVELANKYYGNDYLAFMSKMGSKKSPKLEKPNFKALNPKNKDASSAMALKIENMESPIVEPNYIHFNQDVKILDIRNNLHFYYSRNPMNNIYSLTFKIGIGTYSKPDLELLASYLNRVGTQELKFKDFKSKLQSKGVSIYAMVDKSYFRIYMTGFDNSLASDIQEVSSLLTNTEQNESVLKVLLKEEKLNYKVIKQDIGMQSKILNSYALYGDDSPYLTRLGKKDQKKIGVSELQALLKLVLSYETEIHYVGQLEISAVENILAKQQLFSDNLRRSDSPVDLIAHNINDNHLYFMENKKAVQSHIKISIPSKKANAMSRTYITAYNRYFGYGMSSIVFREIREFRSLAYSAYAYLSVPFNFENPALLTASMTTQADKTNEAIKVMTNLIDSMPIQEVSIEPLKQAILRSYNSQLPGFRYNSQLVAYWMRQGYTEDPRIAQYNKIMHLDIHDIMRVNENFVLGHFHNISLVGDSKRFDLDKLKKQTLFTKLKLKNIYKK
jgi:predicted Zn-dependent peptidase